ncbi:MAG: murein biosynthesis integral membrane protein MurJ [Gammaproteobacteria bacterium]|nr:murein biosynthesis integral membrane protein MurJ [Gammaproteobacteria bacterium]
MSRKLLQSSLVVGSMTLLSRIFGLLRDITLATLFGASGGTDAFLVAFKIPNFMRRLFGEGAFSQAFVPVFSEYKETRSREELQDLINHVAGKLGGILLLITIIGSVAAPALVWLFAPGFHDEPERFQLTAEMLHITFSYIFFISLVAFAGGILNSFNQFSVPAFTPVLLNLTMIAAAIWLSPLMDEPLMALAWGVALAGLLQFLLQLPFLKKLGLIPKPSFKRHHDGVAKILKLMLPAVIGSSVAQINLLLDTIIASFLVAGSVSWLYYSDRLLEFPLGIFGIAIATVILPALSKQHARDSADEFNQTLNWAVRLVLIIAIPACIGLFTLAGPILASLFQYGEFTASDTYLSSLSLMAYMTGLPAMILIKILAPGFYARQDTKTPVRIGIIAMVSNMVMNLLFVVPLVIVDYEAPHIGLALATSCSAYLNAFLLYRGLRKIEVFRPVKGWAKLLMQITIAGATMVVAILWITPELSQWASWAAIDRVAHIAGIIGMAVVIYFVTLMLVGLHPIQLKRSS